FDKEEVEEEKEEITEKYDRKIKEAEEKGREKKVIRLSDRKGRKLAKKDKVLDEGNLFMRWGEPLAVYDSAKASEAAGQMRNYLHTKGFFLATLPTIPIPLERE